MELEPEATEAGGDTRNVNNFSFHYLNLLRSPANVLNCCMALYSRIGLVPIPGCLCLLSAIDSAMFVTLSNVVFLYVNLLFEMF